MIEFGNPVGCGDRRLTMDFAPQLSHKSRTVFQFGRPPAHFPNLAAVATRKFEWTESGLKFAPLPSSIGGMRCFRQGATALIVAVLCPLAAGCNIPHEVGLAERCADIMQRAYPSATIAITKSEAAATSLTTIVARVEGQRTDMPPDGPLRRDLAVECRFDENVLTEFHWTSGPLR